MNKLLGAGQAINRQVWVLLLWRFVVQACECSACELRVRYFSDGGVSSCVIYSEDLVAANWGLDLDLDLALALGRLLEIAALYLLYLRS